jgi:hypothetical protein
MGQKLGEGRYMLIKGNEARNERRNEAREEARQEKS